MIETKTILEANYYLFTEQLVDAVKDGWRVNNTNHGWVSEANGLKEITLFKDPDRTFPEAELGEFVISEHDTQTFLYKLCERIAQGGKVDLDTLDWSLTGIKSIKGCIYLIPKYSKTELAEMDWNDFKEAVKYAAGTGRDRTLLLTRYLQNTGSLV
jgi:hypothetical protein